MRRTLSLMLLIIAMPSATALDATDYEWLVLSATPSDGVVALQNITVPATPHDYQVINRTSVWYIDATYAVQDASPTQATFTVTIDGMAVCGWTVISGGGGPFLGSAGTTYNAKCAGGTVNPGIHNISITQTNTAGNPVTASRYDVRIHQQEATEPMVNESLETLTIVLPFLVLAALVVWSEKSRMPLMWLTTALYAMVMAATVEDTYRLVAVMAILFSVLKSINLLSGENDLEGL